MRKISYKQDRLSSKVGSSLKNSRSPTHPPKGKHMEYENTELRDLLGKKNDDLLEELGRFEAKGLSVTDAIEKGKEFFYNFLTKQHRDICLSGPIRRAFESAEGDRDLEVAAALIDLNAGLSGKPQIALISVLIVKRGLENICEEIWRDE